LSKKPKEELMALLLYAGTTVLYESPRRIEETLRCLLELAPERPLCLARELTKQYEESRAGTAATLLAHAPFRGEIALVIAPPSEEELCVRGVELAELIALLGERFVLTRQEALKMAAKMQGIPKRTAYQAICDLNGAR
jgi:16S rRNA (cytidine1402-2'-O)-methyltransferase